jgi:hypothetical protein
MPKPTDPGAKGRARKPASVGGRMSPPGRAAAPGMMKKPGGLPPGQAKKAPMDPAAAVMAGDTMGQRGRPITPPGLANRPTGMAAPAGMANRTANAPAARAPKPPGPPEEPIVGGGQRAKGKVGSGQKAKATGKGAKANPFAKAKGGNPFAKAKDMKMGKGKPKGMPTSDKRGTKSMRGGGKKPNFMKGGY